MPTEVVPATNPLDEMANAVTIEHHADTPDRVRRAVYVLQVSPTTSARFMIISAGVRSNEVTFNGGTSLPYPPISDEGDALPEVSEVIVRGSNLSRISDATLHDPANGNQLPLSVVSRSDSVLQLRALASFFPGSTVLMENDYGAKTAVTLSAGDGGGAAVLGWAECGIPVCTFEYDQDNARLAEDGSGGAFIAWEDSRDGDGESDIYLQHVTQLGAVYPGWVANGIAVCTAGGNQAGVSICPDGVGGVFLAWVDHRGMSNDVYLQRVTASGGMLYAPNGFPVAATTAEETAVQIALNGSQSASMTWQSGSGIKAAYISSAGSLFTVPITDAGGEPRLACDGIGGACVVWTRPVGLFSYITARYVNQPGTRSPWGPFDITVPMPLQKT
jgi:hypothetical protein